MPDHQPSALFASIGAGRRLSGGSVCRRHRQLGRAGHSAGSGSCSNLNHRDHVSALHVSALHVSDLGLSDLDVCDVHQNQLVDLDAGLQRRRARLCGLDGPLRRQPDTDGVCRRTERSLVAVCVDRDGDLEYRGVRLSDKASLELPVTRGRMVFSSRRTTASPTRSPHRCSWCPTATM